MCARKTFVNRNYDTMKQTECGINLSRCVCKLLSSDQHHCTRWLLQLDKNVMYELVGTYLFFAAQCLTLLLCTPQLALWDNYTVRVNWYIWMRMSCTRWLVLTYALVHGTWIWCAVGISLSIEFQQRRKGYPSGVHPNKEYKHGGSAREMNLTPKGLPTQSESENENIVWCFARPFFDLFWLFFDLFCFRVRFRSVWVSLNTKVVRFCALCVFML